MLARSRALQARLAACDRRYRAQLEATIAHLDEQVAALEREAGQA
jgi:hypothetical protein